MLTEPEEDRPENDVARVVRFVGEALGAVPAALAEVDGDGERGGTRRDVNGRSTGEVKAAEDERPTGRVPGPACDRVVDDGRPTETILLSASRHLSMSATAGAKRYDTHQMKTNTIVGPRRARSAIAPMASMGVIAANMHW